MSNKLRIIMVALVATLLGIISFQYRQINPSKYELPVSIVDLDGNEIIDNTTINSVLLINFWATSCSTCVEEMPQLIKLYQDYHLKGLQIIALAMDYDQEHLIRQFKNNNQIQFHVAHDLNGKIANRYKVAVTPTTILFDQGKINNLWIGPINEDKLRNTVEGLL